MADSLLLRAPLAALVTKATGFALSPAQRALLYIASGARVENIKDAATREAATQALGYSEGPTHPPRIMFINAGARAGKTMLASYIATHRALTCDLSSCAPGEQVRVGFMSASKRQARAGLGYARGFIVALGLGKLIHSDRRDSFTITRGDRDLEFSIIRGNTGGDALAGSWWASLVVHECAIAVDPSSNGSALDLDAVEKATRPRLIPARGDRPGGIIIEETTSRDAHGAAYERAERHGDVDSPCVVIQGHDLGTATG